MKTPHCLVFDSGMGGLTVASELQKQGFSGHISYAADTGFFPYGNKSDADLTRRLPAVVKALIDDLKPDIFVIACNTASTLALQIVREVVDIPVVGTVPAIKPAAQLTQTGTIGVLATPGTLRRAYTDALIHEFARDLTVLTYGSVALVELAERYAVGEAVSDDELRAELTKLTGLTGGNDMDVIVLACTHFPLLRDRFLALVDERVRFIDSGEAIARRVMSLTGQEAGGDVELGKVATTGPSPSLQRLISAAGRFGFTDHHETDLSGWL